MTKKDNTEKRLKKYLQPNKNAIIVILFFSFVGSALLLAGPKQLEKITNIILVGLDSTIDTKSITSIGLALLAIYALGFILNYLKRFIMARVTQDINDTLRNEISEKINKLPLGYFHGVNYGDVLSRVTNDVATIGQTLHQSLPTLITSATLLLGSLIMMLVTNWILAVMVVVTTIIGFYFISKISKKSQLYFNVQQEELGNMNGYIEEMYAGQRIVKIYNAVDEVEENFLKINSDLYNSGWKAQFISGALTPLMSFIGNLNYALICVVGALMVFKGNIKFGVIIAFTIYIRQFNNPLSQITQLVSNIQAAKAASDRVFEFLDEEEMADESHKTKKLDRNKIVGNVSFEHVDFGYSSDNILVNDFSAKAKSGQKIAIVGPTGAGKSTMINLLMRFYEINAGDIKIDDVSIQDMKKENLHDLFGMVLQDTWVFEGTVMENVRYNIDHVTDEEVLEACEKVGLDHFVKTLPLGYQTILDSSTSLSEGQKQQITIARAIVKNAPLLLLDEATSSIDTRTELIIQNAIDELMEGRTSFVVAHRLSTIRNADTILVMKNGDIIEKGNHDELIEQGGFYNELYNSQFSSAS